MKKDFSKPIEIPDAGITFQVFDLMPKYEDIPQEFSMYNGTSPFCELQTKWFYHGLETSEIPVTKPGIDRTKALRYLGVIQNSFEPRHEHKCAAVAYLMSLWFEEPKEIKPWKNIKSKVI